MNKSNHQKHGFHPPHKGQRRDKTFVPYKKYFRQLKREAMWNGWSLGDVFGDELGRVESIRLYNPEALE